MRILVVEDEKNIASAIKKGLEQEAFSIDIALDGDEGYDLASTEEYSVIVLDLMLPGMSGIEICKALREDGDNTPILVLTAKSETEDKVTGLNTGADDYLTKPFEFEELVARIRALLRRPPVTFDTKLEYDDLCLNPATFKVMRGKSEVNLSKKEFSLLEYLLRNKNKILTKEQIIENVWSFDADVLPNTVEVYIGYLRNKIDKPFKKSKKLIHTVRGFGYKLG